MLICIVLVEKTPPTSRLLHLPVIFLLISHFFFLKLIIWAKIKNSKLTKQMRGVFAKKATEAKKFLKELLCLFIYLSCH